MRKIPGILMALNFSVTLFAQDNDATDKNKRPNIIIVLADDLGYSDLSIQGCQDFETPNIDRIGRNGIQFTEGYVTNSVSAPSRAGLLTGRVGFGFEANLPNNTNLGLDTLIPTIAKVLKNGGYKTFGIGKWHLGYDAQFHPNKRGFDEFYGLLGGSRSYYALKKRNAHKSLQYNGVYEDEVKGTYVTNRLTNKAVSFINEHVKKDAEQPFFMYLSYTAPHAPLHPNPAHKGRFTNIKNDKRSKYASMVVTMDEGVGEVLNCLEDNEIVENTFIVFLSDNGGPLAGGWTTNKPLRQGKGSLFEGGIRVPFLIQWKGHIPKGLVVDNPVTSLDLLPSFADLAQIPQPDSLNGVSLWPWLKNPSSEIDRPLMFWRRGEKKHGAVRDGNYKWKLNRRKGTQSLYNLKEDAGERINLIKKHPQKASKMAQKFKEWEESVKDPTFSSGYKSKKNKKK